MFIRYPKEILEKLDHYRTSFIEYTIKSGDTFYSLAQKFNTTVSAIIELNPNVNSTNLQLGQIINIPIEVSNQQNIVTVETATRPILVNNEDINKGLYPVLNYKPKDAEYPYIYVPIAEFTKVGAKVKWNDAQQSLTVNSDYDQLKDTFEKLTEENKQLKSLMEAQLKIESIDNITVSINPGDAFTLPKYVTATLGDNTEKDIAVSWTSQTVDTNKIGTYTFEGTVEGYDKKVTLTLIIEKRGNTPANLVNFGYVVKKDHWIYIRNIEDTFKLYKIKTDGSEKIKLNDDKVGFINILDDWIYYTNFSDGDKIYKIKSDGTQRTKINDDSSWQINVIGDWIYYINNSQSKNIYKIKTDGTGRKMISSYRVSLIWIIGEWIYYLYESIRTRENKLFRVRTDGTSTAKLSDEPIYTLNVIGNWIYYTSALDERKLYKMKINGTGRTKLTDEYTLFINVVNDWIYYSNGRDNHSLYKIKTDGTNKTKLNNEESYSINIVDDWIYYTQTTHDYIANKNKRIMYKIKTDGSERQVVFYSLM